MKTDIKLRNILIETALKRGYSIPEEVLPKLVENLKQTLAKKSI